MTVSGSTGAQSGENSGDSVGEGFDPAPLPAGSTRGTTRREFVAAVGASTVGATVLGAPLRADAAASAPIYRIHPAVGIARLGNLDPDYGFVLGPEVPGGGPTDGLSGAAVAQHKLGGSIKPQGARFRVFEYAKDALGRLTPVREVVPGTSGSGLTVKEIVWTVHLANRKASFYEEDGPTGESRPAGALRNPNIVGTARDALESDFGPRTIAGASASPAKFRYDNAGSGYSPRWVRGADGKTPVIDYLGQLRTDASGRLMVFGGKGVSGSNVSPPQPLTHWSNNNFWFDDISDGPVTATVVLEDRSGTQVRVPMDRAGSAWVLVAPPNFSPDLRASVSLYDVLYDMGTRSLPVPSNALYYGGALDRLRQLHDAWAAGPNGGLEFGSFAPDYVTEIWPMVLNAANYVFTTALVNFKHVDMLHDPLGDNSTSAAKGRQTFFGFVRPPGAAATTTTGPGTMPRMYGDNWYVGNENFVYTFGQNGPGNAGGVTPTPGHRSVPKDVRYQTLTPTQYGLLRAWTAGNFVPLSQAGLPAPSVISPHGLDRANLENCIGGPFYPGIECSWQMRNPALFAEPFRLRYDPTALNDQSRTATSQYLLPNGAAEGTPIRAGHFSRQMALPWQADFNDCSKLLNLAWWPSARSDDVFLRATDGLKDRVPWMRPDTVWASGGTGAAYEDMVANWFKLGFVLESAQGSAIYVEQERNSHVP